MSATPISSHELKNGLVLIFMDESKKIAGDRWYVRVGVSIEIPVDKRWFADGSMDDVRFNQIAEALGEKVVFSQKKERNFVSDDTKEQLIQDICKQTREMGQAYMGSDSFAAKFILKSYAERQQRPLL